MPIYEYSCVCGNKAEKFVHKIRPCSHITCPKCGRRMDKIFSRVNATTKGYPHLSSSLGINISQIAEAKRIWPDAEFDRKGNFIVTSRSSKLKMARRRNLVELD